MQLQGNGAEWVEIYFSVRSEAPQIATGCLGVFHTQSFSRRLNLAAITIRHAQGDEKQNITVFVSQRSLITARCSQQHWCKSQGRRNLNMNTRFQANKQILPGELAISLHSALGKSCNAGLERRKIIW